MAGNELKDRSGQEMGVSDSAALTEFEKRVFRGVMLTSLMGALACGLIAFATGSNAWITGAGWLILIAIIFAIFWFFQACLQSLRDYGLGEGMANLYGEERAKMMFGENYKRPGPTND